MVVLEAYGARLALSAPDELILGRILAGAPAGWSPADAEPKGDEVEWTFAVTGDVDVGFRVRDGDGGITECGTDLDLVISLLRLQLRRFVGYHTPDLIFVHAGAVAHNGRAIVLPGHSFSGKSTLVAALVRAGAVYYSDEYAVFDESGRVLPYREPIALRTPAGVPGETLSAEQLGSRAGEDPVAVALLALTAYRPGARWEPTGLSRAQGLHALLEHAVPVRDRPEHTLSVLGRALENADVLHGERGESDETARSLLERL